jgi:thiol-disulfide isomerase/thioredoxin|tara:strand:- start:3941 stop:4270 length:330 start_codon:yes stop_codon:yes gene_type:complete
MARKIERLQKESILNNIFRRKKEENFNVLYYSKWDKYSKTLLEHLDKWVEQEGDETVYIVNSWDLPHSFVAYNVTQVPCLIQAIKGRIRKTEYLPYIYKSFKLSNRNQA